MNIIDKLLSLDKEEITKERTKTYESKNLKRLLGDGTITLKKVPEKKLKERMMYAVDSDGNTQMEKVHDASLLIVLDGVKEPDMKDQRLLDHFGVATPKDLIDKLFDGEIADIADAITEFDKTKKVEKEVKN